MTRPLALLRPEPGWSASALSARAAGLEVVGHPLARTMRICWEVPGGAFDALLVGSAAVFRCGGAELAQLVNLPVYAVGEATAAAAEDAGFRVARTGRGNLQQLVNEVAGERRHFLRLAGEERVPVSVRPSQAMTEIAVYRLEMLPISADFAAMIAARRPLVALHSAAAARQFASEIDRVDIPRGSLPLLALGPRIAAAAGDGWSSVHVADSPEEGALLAKARTLCNEPADKGQR